MSLIPMIGGLLERRQKYCEHHKIPKIVPDSMKYNPAIRLQDVSRLRKLGGQENGGCKECNEDVCSCLWTHYVEKSTARKRKSTKSSPVTDNTLGKNWTINRNQLLDKIRESYTRCKNKQITPSHNKFMYRNNSLIWLLRPTTKIHRSETNMTKAKVKKYQQDPDKYPPTAETQQDPLELAIPKGTKEYYNVRKRSFDGQLQGEPLVGNELDGTPCNKRKLQTTVLYPTYTELKHQKLRKKLLDYKKNILSTEDHIKKPLNMSTEASERTSVVALSALTTPIASKYNFTKSQLHTRCNNQPTEDSNQLKDRNNRTSEISHGVYKSIIESNSYEMASGQPEKTTVLKGTPREPDPTYFSCSKTMVIKDYICLKRSETHSNLTEIRPEKRVQRSTQTMNTSQVEDTTSSMIANCTDSCSRISDLEDISVKTTETISNSSSRSTKVLTTTKRKRNKDRKQQLSGVKKPRLSELTEVDESRISEATTSVMAQSSRANTSKVSGNSQDSTSKVLANELSQVTNSKILHTKNLDKHKQFLRKRFKKPNFTSSSQSTVTEEVDNEEESTSGVTKFKIIPKSDKESISTKSSLSESSTQPKRLNNLRGRRIGNKRKIHRQPIEQDISPELSIHFKADVSAAEKQPSLVIVSNDTCTYSFHRPISYDELHHPKCSK